MKPIDYEIRRATPSECRPIAAAHVDSIRTIGPQFYAAGTVSGWGSGLTSDIYVKAMEGGEAFWLAVGDLGSERVVLSSYRSGSYLARCRIPLAAEVMDA